MTTTEQCIPKVPFPVAGQRFDQKNEMFKRSHWDEKMKSQGIGFNREFKIRQKPGYRQLDYALRNAAWNLEWDFAIENSRINSGRYAWKGANQKIRHYIEAGRPIENPTAENSRIIKRAARYFGADLVGICQVHPNWVYAHEYNIVTTEH